jgi:hypothetical protein
MCGSLERLAPIVALASVFAAVMQGIQNSKFGAAAGRPMTPIPKGR